MERIDPSQSGIAAPPGDATLVINRSFAAPRELVWRCYTDPVHLVHFWGPHGSTCPLSEVDLRVGGRWRQVMRFSSGNEYGYTSAYLEIAAPARLVWRDAPDDYRFGDPLPPITMHTITSRDGTRIAYDVYGQGEPVILVEGAFCGRHFGDTHKLAAALGKQFRVTHYDRRARGDSGPSTDYSMERELEDLSALIAEAGGSASIIGFSSGACLAIEAAAAGLPIKRLAFYEPPYMVGPKARKVPANFEAEVQQLVADGKHGDAVAYFMTKLIGMPSIFLIPMKFSKMWKQITPQAASLPFDMAAVNGFNPPIERMRRIAVPTLAIHGDKTFPVLVDSTKLCAQTIPGARHVVLPGQSHEVKAEAIAPELIRFFAGAEARIAA